MASDKLNHLDRVKAKAEFNFKRRVREQEESKAFDEQMAKQAPAPVQEKKK